MANETKRNPTYVAGRQKGFAAVISGVQQQVSSLRAAVLGLRAALEAGKRDGEARAQASE